jgi:hypothetical protein
MNVKIATIALITCLLVLAGCVRLGSNEAGGIPPQQNISTQPNPDMPPPFPEENTSGSPANPDMPPPLPD